ncbi:MAG: thermonuclease family protein [Planctomycetes bacterium]|nr:thermonuclease family protein [Planctomycetota bacterium]MCW8135434.1 thermonuclease family protein [Planctomycetota bacterium]
MARANQRGKLNPGATALVLLVIVALVGVVLWQSGIMPFHLRSDGIYGSGEKSQPCGESSTAIARPKLYLPAPDKKLRNHTGVKRVIDGDTLEMADGARVRLIGIDCPELGKDKVEPDSHAFKATMYLFTLLEADPQVRLEYDKERKDKYERTLAYVYLPDGRMLNELMLEQGWADTMTIEPNTKYAAKFAALRDEAKRRARGIWGAA